MTIEWMKRLVGGTPVGVAVSAENPLPAADQNGRGAVRYTSNSVAVTGNFSYITCLTSVTFLELTRTNATGSLEGIMLPAGTLLVGPFTAYTLSSGTIAAYA